MTTYHASVFELPANPAGRSRRPFAIITVNLMGAGETAGRARLQMRVENSPGAFGAWQTVSESSLQIDTGSSLTLAGGIAPTHKTVQMRVGIAPEYDGNGGGIQNPESNGFNGIFFALR